MKRNHPAGHTIIRISDVLKLERLDELRHEVAEGCVQTRRVSPFWRAMIFINRLCVIIGDFDSPLN